MNRLQVLIFFQGFMSVCCLLRPDWTGCSQEERDRLPGKIVYKFSYSGGLEAVARTLLSCNVNEEVIYDALRKVLVFYI